MKKIISLVMAALMAMIAVSALAETEMIGNSRLSLDLSGLEIYELDEEDIEDDAVLCFGNEEETMVCYVYEYASDGYTLQELEAEVLQEETGVTASGYTTINDIECFCMVIDDEGNYVVYFAIVDDEILQFEFEYQDDTAELTGVVMNTLRVN